MSGGSPGGALIIHYTAKTLYGALQWGCRRSRPSTCPISARSMALAAGKKRFPPATVEQLRARGAEVREMNMTSGRRFCNAARPRPPAWLGGADPRCEGVVMGD